MTRRRWIVALGLALVLGLGGSYVALSKSLPEGTAGQEADDLARAVEEAAGKAGWEHTGAVTWNFGGRNQHLWDRTRNLSQVEWGSGNDLTRVQFRLDDHSKGVVTRGGKPVTGDDKTKLIAEAYAKWINDSFWLNPVMKVFDSGTVRKLVPPEEGLRRLLISYTSGGLTPGDSYLYTLGPDNLPTQWEMWVSIIPIGGVKATFENWETLSTGAKISTRHKMAVKTLELTGVKGAETVEALMGSDVFAPLLAEK